MLDEFIGKVGTPERDEYEAKLKKEVGEYFIGEAVKKIRKKQGMTKEKLGEQMGVRKSQVSLLESGKGITYSTIVRAFRALGAQTANLDLGSLGWVALW